jgi:hypothetical protein
VVLVGVGDEVLDVIRSVWMKGERMRKSELMIIPMKIINKFNALRIERAVDGVGRVGEGKILDVLKLNLERTMKLGTTEWMRRCAELMAQGALVGLVVEGVVVEFCRSGEVESTGK